MAAGKLGKEALRGVQSREAELGVRTLPGAQEEKSTPGFTLWLSLPRAESHSRSRCSSVARRGNGIVLSLLIIEGIWRELGPQPRP